MSPRQTGRGSSEVSIIPVLFTLLLAGCGFFAETYDVSVLLPDFTVDPAPPESRILFWEISWLDREGSVSACRVPGGKTVILSLPKEHPLIISAFPMICDIPSSFTYRPAGCLRSADLPAVSEVSLSWEDGFSAFFMLELARSGIDPGRINIRKFQEAVIKRGGTNPWLLNLHRLVSDLTSGDLWIYSFSLPEVHTVVLPLTPGYWYSDYPPEPPLLSVVPGWSGELSEGLHRFLNESGTKCLTVSIGAGGEVTLLTETWSPE